MAKLDQAKIKEERRDKYLKSLKRGDLLASTSKRDFSAGWNSCVNNYDPKINEEEGINEMTIFKKALKSLKKIEPNAAKDYAEMKPKYALINITQGDIYEVGNTKKFSLAGFEGEIEPGDKVAIVDIENDKIIRRMTSKLVESINEMAEKDLEGIDFEKLEPKEAAKAYVNNYKKRTEKPFTKAALTAMKKTLTKDPAIAKAEEVLSAAKAFVEEGAKKEPKKKADSKSKAVVNSGAIKDRAAEAALAMKEEILKNAGISLNEKVDVYEIKKEKNR